MPKPKTTRCQKYYEALHSRCGAVLLQSFGTDASLQGACQNNAKLLDEWAQALSSRPEADVYVAAVREMQLAQLSLSLGQYRQAFMGLRLSLELGLAAIHFSAHELEYRKWVRDKADVKWSELIDKKTGVLSPDFVAAFFEDLKDEALHYQSLAEKAYRECSEYVHGNAHTHSGLPATLAFSEEAFRNWHSKADTIHLVVSFALCMRHLSYMDKGSVAKVCDGVRSTLGHVGPIRAMLDAK